MAGHSAGVFAFLHLLPAWTGAVLPGAAALVIAAALGLAGRRVAWLGAVAAPLAMAVGWALAAGWRDVLWPRGVAEHVVVPALVVAVACGVQGRGRSRWVAAGVAGFCGWWLAGALAARPEFWRVLFGAWFVAWVLARGDAGWPERGLAVALTVWLGVLAGGGAGVWPGMALVAVGAGLGVMVGGWLPPVLLMVLVVATLLGAGRVVRGGVGVVDLACAGALLTPWMSGWCGRAVSARLPRQARGAGGVLGAGGTAVLVAGAAWVGVRVLHLH